MVKEVSKFKKPIFYIYCVFMNEKASFQLFIDYVVEDESYFNELQQHLNPLIKQGKLTIWDESKMSAGEEKMKTWSQHLEEADLILLLISTAYINSKKFGIIESELISCSDKIIPIIIRDCLWQETAIKKCSQILPNDLFNNQRPINQWEYKENAYTAIGDKIKDCLKARAVPPIATLSFPITLSDREAFSIFTDVVKKYPLCDRCFICIIDGKECVVGLTKENINYGIDVRVSLFILYEFAHTWVIETEKVILSIDCRYFEELDVDIVNIENVKHVYFQYKIVECGNATPNFRELHFGLLSLEDRELTSLQYNGDVVLNEKKEEIYIEGTFTNINEFKTKPTLLSFLEQKAAACELLYRDYKKDNNHFEKCKKKWNLDNPNIVHVWPKDECALSGKLRITFYDDPLFSIDQEKNNQVIENEIYKVIALQECHILVYHKIKKQYFPAWIEPNWRFSQKRIQFQDKNIVKTTYEREENKFVFIDLEKMTYRKVDLGIGYKTKFNFEQASRLSLCLIFLFAIFLILLSYDNGMGSTIL